jgi:hypothetical protein
MKKNCVSESLGNFPSHLIGSSFPQSCPNRVFVVILVRSPDLTLRERIDGIQVDPFLFPFHSAGII